MKKKKIRKNVIETHITDQLIDKKSNFCKKKWHTFTTINNIHTCTGDTLPLSTLSILSPVFAPKNAEMIFKPVTDGMVKRERIN